MSRRALEFLEDLLAVLPGLPHEPKQGGRPPIPLRKQILITLWVLGNQESLRSVAYRFGVTRSCAYRVYRRLSDLSSFLVGQGRERKAKNLKKREVFRE